MKQKIMGGIGLNGKRYLMLFVLLLLVTVLFTLIKPAFFSYDNLQNTMIGITLPVIISIGMAIVISAGGLDMSIGVTCGLTAMVGSMMMVNAKTGIPAAVIGAVLCGVLVGAFNGFLVAYMGISSFIATLATQFLIQGLRYWLSNGLTFSRFPAAFTTFGTGKVWGIPNLFIVMLALALIVALIIRETTFGRRLTSLGMNMEASRYSGVNTRRLTMLSFVLCSAFAAICGILMAAKTSNVTVASGDSYTLDSITIAVFSAVVFKRLRMTGIIMAAIFVTIVSNGMSMAGIDSSWISLTKGMILLAAVVSGRFLNR